MRYLFIKIPQRPQLCSIYHIWMKKQECHLKLWGKSLKYEYKYLKNKSYIYMQIWWISNILTQWSDGCKERNITLANHYLLIIVSYTLFSVTICISSLQKVFSGSMVLLLLISLLSKNITRLWLLFFCCFSLKETFSFLSYPWRKW